MNATELKARLRADLKAAMQARQAEDTRVLRELIAAIDNAEAVPVASTPYRPHAFGEPGNEAARLALDSAAIETLLTAEVAARVEAAADYERRGRDQDAARLRRDAELVSRYAERSLQTARGSVTSSRD